MLGGHRFPLHTLLPLQGQPAAPVVGEAGEERAADDKQDEELDDFGIPTGKLNFNLRGSKLANSGAAVAAGHLARGQNTAPSVANATPRLDATPPPIPPPHLLAPQAGASARAWAGRWTVLCP